MPPEDQTQQPQQTSPTTTTTTELPKTVATESPSQQPPPNETAEQKAAREAAEKAKLTETPEQKAAREKAEADKKAADEKAAKDAEVNDTKKNPFKADEIKFKTEGVSVDKDLANDFVKLVNEEGVSRPLAQKLIALQEKATVLASEKMNQMWTDTQSGWRKEIEADADIGGKNLPTSQGLLAKAIDHYAAKLKMDAHVVRQAFDITGAGDNPAIVKLFVGMARDLVQEGGPAAAGAVSTEKSLAEKIYKTQAK